MVDTKKSLARLRELEEKKEKLEEELKQVKEAIEDEVFIDRDDIRWLTDAEYEFLDEECDGDEVERAMFFVEKLISLRRKKFSCSALCLGKDCECKCATLWGGI